MSVRPGRINPRPTASEEVAYQAYSFPGPSLGLVSDKNLAMSQPGGAYVLDNIFPTQTGGVLRRGKRRHSELGLMPRTLFTYEQGNVSRMFAITDEDVWDISSDTPASKYTVTDGYFSTAQYTTTDGVLFVRGVNGHDEPWVYDGDAFVTTPALTFEAEETADPEDLSFTWVFKNRFFFIKKESLDVFYLPVGQIGGGLVKFSLGGVFTNGGSLVYGGNWSQETGSGLSSMCVFITDKGEVAVYQGNNPSDANDWQRVGVYSVGKPLGQNAVIQRGGDLAICTDVGLIALSQALLRDATALSPTAMSRPIEAVWTKYVSERYEKRWAATSWTDGQMLVVAPPTISGQTPIWLVSNATTGRWCRYTAWDATCLAVFNGGLYFGSPDGNVYQANVGGSDDGQPYVGVYVPVFDQMGTPGRKAVHMARVVMRSRFPVRDRLSIHSDFSLTLPPPYDAAPIGDADVWGTAKWNAAKWGGSSEANRVQSRWRNTLGEGEAVTIGHQITSASVAPLDVEIIRTDVLFTVGEQQS